LLLNILIGFNFISSGRPMLLCKGPSIKDVRNQGGFVQFGQEGSSDADVRTFDAKNFGIFESCGVSVRTRGRGLIFRDLVRTSFMDGS